MSKHSNDSTQRSGVAELLAALFGVASEGVGAIREAAEPKLERGRFWLRVIVLGLMLWPVALLLISLATPAATVDWLVATIALAVPSMILVALVVKWPLISIAIAAVSARVVAAQRVLGGLLLVVFFELGAGIYLAVVPVERAPELLPLRILVLAAMGTLALSVRLLGIKESAFARSMTAILVVLLIGITAVTFAGGMEGLKETMAETAPSSVCAGEPESYTFGPGATQMAVTSRDGCWTGWVTTPPETSYRIDFTRPIDIQFWDGTALSDVRPNDPQWVGVKRGIFRFRGAAEVTVTVD